jgi:hypothetical protein
MFVAKWFKLIVHVHVVRLVNMVNFSHHCLFGYWVLGLSDMHGSI